MKLDETEWRGPSTWYLAAQKADTRKQGQVALTPATALCFRARLAPRGDKAGTDKAVIWVSRWRDTGRGKTTNMQKLSKKVLISASLQPTLKSPHRWNQRQATADRSTQEETVTLAWRTRVPDKKRPFSWPRLVCSVTLIRGCTEARERRWAENKATPPAAVRLAGALLGHLSGHGLIFRGPRWLWARPSPARGCGRWGTITLHLVYLQLENSGEVLIPGYNSHLEISLYSLFILKNVNILLYDNCGSGCMTIYICQSSWIHT